MSDQQIPEGMTEVPLRSQEAREVLHPGAAAVPTPEGEILVNIAVGDPRTSRGRPPGAVGP